MANPPTDWNDPIPPDSAVKCDSSAIILAMFTVANLVIGWHLQGSFVGAFCLFSAGVTFRSLWSYLQ